MGDGKKLGEMGERGKKLGEMGEMSQKFREMGYEHPCVTPPLRELETKMCSRLYRHVKICFTLTLMHMRSNWKLVILDLKF